MQLTQDELKEFHDNGQTVILNYRKAYQVRYNRNTESFTFSNGGMPSKPSGLPYTKRGRFFAMTPNEAEKIIYG